MIHCPSHEDRLRLVPHSSVLHMHVCGKILRYILGSISMNHDLEQTKSFKRLNICDNRSIKSISNLVWSGRFIIECDDIAFDLRNLLQICSSAVHNARSRSHLLYDLNLRDSNQRNR